jgi:hypothetical protein
MSSFKRTPNGDITIVFTSQEAHVLINLTEQLLELLGEGEGEFHQVDPLLHLVGISNADAPPEDPVLRRLLPNAYDDEREAGEFRRYTEHGLREKKKAHAHLIYESLLPQDEEWSADAPLDKATIEISIPESDAMAWLGGLNDLRLALAVRLDIGTERRARNSQDSQSEAKVADDLSAFNDGAKGEATQDQYRKKYELMAESDPMKAVYAVYSWIGWLQQSLLECLD